MTYAELQQQLKERAQTKFGADVDTRKSKKKDFQKKPIAAQQIDSMLTLPLSIFVTNDGNALTQISLTNVQTNARGVAFAGPQDVQQFLADGRMISPEGLAVLVVRSFRGHRTCLACPYDESACHIQRHKRTHHRRMHVDPA